MDAAVLRDIENLRRMSVGGLREKYREVFGEDSRSHHKGFLFRRVAWRLQAVAEGGLSERARRRALEIANDADLRIRAPKDFGPQGADAARRTVVGIIDGRRDCRLPEPGTLVTREFKGQTFVVKVLADNTSPRDLLGAAGEQEDFRSIFARAAQGLQMGCDSAGPEKIRRKLSCSPAATRSHATGPHFRRSGLGAVNTSAAP